MSVNPLSISLVLAKRALPLIKDSQYRNVVDAQLTIASTYVDEMLLVGAAAGKSPDPADPDCDRNYYENKIIADVAGGLLAAVIVESIIPVAATAAELLLAGAAAPVWLPFVGVVAIAFVAGALGDELGELLLPGARAFTDWLSETFGPYLFRPDPLILDLSLGGDGVSLVALAQGNVYFDLNNDGFAERTAWAAADAGFVVLDRNGNGTIDNGGEMFGDASRNGFAMLADLDANADGVISSQDAAYASLRIWRDANQDGVSQAGELSTLADAGVTSIDVANVTTYYNTRLDSQRLKARGSFTTPTGDVREAVAVDFTVDLINTQYILPEGFQYDPEVFALPNLRGYGDVPDLWVAMSLDPTLKEMVQDYIADLPASGERAGMNARNGWFHADARLRRPHPPAGKRHPGWREQPADRTGICRAGRNRHGPAANYFLPAQSYRQNAG